MGFVADTEQPSGRFAPDEASQTTISDYLKSAATKLGPTLLPGGAGMQMMKMLDSAAYDLGGVVTDKTGSPAAGAAANVAVQAVPMVLGGETAKLASPVVQNTARDLMQSALKPTYGMLKSGDAARAITTMLENGFNVSKGGVANMRSKIAALNDEIATAIENSTATVDKAKVASTLQDTLKKFEQQVNPSSDVKAIEAAWNEFMAHPLLAGSSQIPVQLAQKLKQGTYRILGGKYGEAGSAATEAQKGLARGLKEGVAEAVPGVSVANKAEGELINASDIAERRVLMDSNKNPLGLGILHPETLAIWLADRSPLAKSLLARLLNFGHEQIPANVGRVAGGTLGAISGQPEGALLAPRQNGALSR